MDIYFACKQRSPSEDGVTDYDNESGDAREQRIAYNIAVMVVVYIVAIIMACILYIYGPAKCFPSQSTTAVIVMLGILMISSSVGAARHSDVKKRQ